MDFLAWAVLGAAAGVAFLHTLLGPDHFLPFVMLARARSVSARWSAGPRPWPAA